MPVNAPATTIPVLANDTGDPPLTIASATDPANGTVEVAVDGLCLTYQPDADFHGTDTFDYTITDGVTTDDGTVTVDVNSPPVAVDDPGVVCQPGRWRLSGPRGLRRPDASRRTTSRCPGHCGLLHNDTDPDDDSLTWQIVTQPAHGTVVKVDEDGFAYKPNPDYSATDHGLPATDFDTFTYQGL